MIQVTLPNGDLRNYPEGSTPMDVAKDISQGLAKNVLAATNNEEQIELLHPLPETTNLKFYTWEDELGRKSFWHSSAHLMAEAIQFFYPDAKFTIGPAIEKGFYYDIDFGDEVLSEKEFSKIEKKIKELSSKKNTYELYPISKKEALEYYSNNEFKTELIENLEDGEITFCKQGDFTDLCRGGHITTTGQIKAVKILSVAGAYWRADQTKKQLTRVYGVSFPKQKMLEEYLFKLEEAKKRDHRKLGKELELFTFSTSVGQGLPMWLPNGVTLRKVLENYLTKIQEENGYQQVMTPHIGQKHLYETSGHYEKYGKDSFQPIQSPDLDEEFLLKPMNCPHHCEIYKNRNWSYRELPVRYAEFGTVYRYEQSGELHGLTRVRGFTQDDAHIFCTPHQLQEEFKKVIDLVLKVFNTVGFDNYKAQISLRDKEDTSKYIGEEQNWELAEKAIIDAVKDKDLDYIIEYGEAAFYGPKLDFMVSDALGRKWQLGTIQVDYNLPERFDLTYKNSNNDLERPIMIHRAPFGSIERFIAILLEHTGGNLPVWLSPTQVVVLPIADKFNNYAEKVSSLLKNHEIRTLVDKRREKIGKKIRDSELKKIPFMLIVGENEEKENSVSIRIHRKGDVGEMSLDNFVREYNFKS